MKWYSILLVGALAHGTVLAADKPNIIVILTDDQGWGDLSIHGNKALSTSNIDRMAQEGARFDRFYVSPVCSPTRAEFLTGQHHTRCGVYDTSAGGERVNPDKMMIGELFKRAGYKTAAFGKWHSGMQYPYHPNARGFDEFYGFCSGHWGNYFSPILEHNGQIIEGNGFVVDDFTERAMKYIEQHQDEPFFVYLPYNTPHSPMQVPDRWWNKFKDLELTQDHPKREFEKVDHTRAALAMCENIDWNVGRLLAKIDELRLAHNTIVLYLSDNGPNGDRWNGGMRGRKGATDEGGVRSPLFVRWPARIEAGTKIPQICSVLDLMPTLAEMAGVEVAEKMPLAGVSLAPLLYGNSSDWKERTLVHHWKGKVSVRTQRHRLDHEGRLYDIAEDPGQTKAVNNKVPEIADAMRKVADKFRSEMLVNYGKEFDDRPFVIGHSDSIFTQIPARDGIGHGNITRSNRFPNDSYFQNWTSLDDSITWNCEVGETGTYLVELFYTCPKADIGSTIELSFRGNVLTGKITEPHDPPLMGMEHDRFKRKESYVKNFNRKVLGKIQLKQGEGTLQLRALEIAGSKVMDFRLMLLTRVD
ncbi:Arylsulfatase [Adhaeretor mobilis]|uniref:Arylsulfatase n=2 Tax=Adhaeretor mobilis TaxID=1930276 RepID=A0A517MTE2_9BACT|nr:Arylsulfatase [Adhaeretor mobilis]